MPAPSTLEIDRNFVDTLSDQAKNPPGNDPVLGSLYTVVLDMASNEGPMAETLRSVKRRRPDITNTHLVNLLPRTIQYMRLKEHDLLNVATFTTPEHWEAELSRVLYDEPTRQTWENLLVNKSTTTTVYQRSAGPYALIAYLYDGVPVSIADLGCGGNYTLRGMELRESFKAITDETPNQIVTRLISQRVNLRRGLGIDKENPDDREVRDWRLACRYPEELREIPEIVRFEERLREGSRRVQFLQADLVSFDWLPRRIVDVVILSTILYQLKPEEQVILLTRAKSLLKPDGILAVQDFAAKDPQSPTTLRFDETWSGLKFGYRTFLSCRETDWTCQEALQWMGGRCNVVRAGEDFDEIFIKTPPYSKALRKHSNGKEHAPLIIAAA
ncbi:hypothetical protein HYS95_00280 [Candidatus Daviesbacteria bacterium]|nr:hypothetical protein [Candidatus Daviesbacteria bacterium]